MRGIKTFIPNRPELENKLLNLKPVVEVIKGYTQIAEKVNAELDKVNVPPISGGDVHRMIHRQVIPNEYVCRVVIKQAVNYIEEVKKTIDNFNP